MRKVDDKTVRKAIAAGKIPLVNGLIDPEIADAAWERNRDGGQQSKLAESIDASGNSPSALFEEPAALEVQTSAIEPKKSEQPQPEAQPAPLTQARIANVEVSTAIREITRRRLEADLLEREEVERTWGEVLQAVKDRLRLIPDNIGDLLAVTTDAAECRSIVMREILDALASTSKTVAGMAA